MNQEESRAKPTALERKRKHGAATRKHSGGNVLKVKNLTAEISKNK